MLLCIECKSIGGEKVLSNRPKSQNYLKSKPFPRIRDLRKRRSRKRKQNKTDKILTDFTDFAVFFFQFYIPREY